MLANHTATIYRQGTTFSQPSRRKYTIGKELLSLSQFAVITRLHYTGKDFHSASRLAVGFSAVPVTRWAAHEHHITIPRGHPSNTTLAVALVQLTRT